MTLGGVIMVILAWGFIIGLCGYCFYRLLAEKRGK
jgi:hypothetical protein